MLIVLTQHGYGGFRCCNVVVTELVKLVYFIRGCQETPLFCLDILHRIETPVPFYSFGRLLLWHFHDADECL